MMIGFENGISDLVVFETKIRSIRLPPKASADPGFQRLGTYVHKSLIYPLLRRLLKKSAWPLETGNRASNQWKTNSREAVWYRPKSQLGSGVWRMGWLYMMMPLMQNPGGQFAHRRESDRS